MDFGALRRARTRNLRAGRDLARRRWKRSQRPLNLRGVCYNPRSRSEGEVASRADGPYESYFVYAALRLGPFRRRPLAIRARHSRARSGIVQWSGQHGGSDIASTRLLRNADGCNAFWKQVERDRPRPLDVANEMAVAIFLG